MCDLCARVRGDEWNECLIEDEFRFISFRSDDDDDGGYGGRVGVKPTWVCSRVVAIVVVFVVVVVAIEERLRTQTSTRIE